MDIQINIQNVVSELSTIINMNLKNLAAEQYHPSMDPDMSDEAIIATKSKVLELRSLRNKFENIMTEAVL